MEQMAISNYLGAFIALLVCYPFLLVALNIAIYDVKTRSRYTFWFNITCVLLAIILLTLHMQVEVIFGKELLDKWYSNHP
ncbi:hypothetical protein MHO82_14285 [Vibrio sp. Of7-15]|uniref:hypothetical protein n=1 Tax=Vibrio sp. Of7-15 TaxID=2724879 RepID=UPI001EF1A69B|nr:hypothetical protein [Vibrio sp. Of7-15]MCG7498035.1 hypothetical protein [Vibrio sp. Of7-15]